MIRVCCSELHVGKKVFGEKEPFEDKSETHGFCNPCFRLELEKATKAALEDKNNGAKNVGKI